MSKKLTDEFLKWTLDVDGKPAMAALNSMEQSTKKLQNTNRALSTEMAKLEAQGKKNTAEYAALNRQFITNNQTISQAQARMAQLRGEIGLNSLTASQLRQRMNELRRAMDQATPNSAAWTAHQRDLTAVTNRYNQVRSAATGTHSIFGRLQGLLPVIGFAAVAAGVQQLISNIISVRKEFEKYEAVLTNTLGSNKKARMEMQMLQKFAAETPFALTELTGAFVKLTNYGLKPTRNEMRQYGDLASSVGKGFDQLAEGVADAVTGEFERLKEFGIKAKKEGDKITFTFKEQTTVVDNSAASIKKYITGLGDMQGVAGSMAAIAQTLGGKISNMGDAWDGLMNTLGAGTSGVMVTVITWMTDFVTMLDYSFKSIKQLKEAVKDEAIVAGMNNAITEIDTMTRKMVANGSSFAEAHAKAIENYNNSIQSSMASTQAEFAGKTEGQKIGLAKRLNFLIEERAAVKEHYAGLDKIKQQQKGDAANEIDLIKRKEKELVIIKAMPGATLKEIAARNAATAAKEKEIETLKSLGVIKENDYSGAFKPKKLKVGVDYELEKEEPLDMNWITAQDDPEVKIFEKKKQTQEDWTKFLENEVEKQTAILTDGLDIEMELESAREELKSVRIDAIGQIAGALSGMFEQGSAAQIAFFALEKALGIASVWVNYAKEASAIAASNAWMGPLAIPVDAAMIGAAKIRAITNTAIIVAQAVGQVASSKKGKQSGGYADSDANDSTPVGIYHANEFIASGPAVRNPTVKPILDIIDIAQRTGTIKSLNLAGIISGGKQEGGYAGSGSSSSSVTIGRDPELSATLKELNLVLKSGIIAKVNKFGHGGIDESISDINKFNGLTK